MVRVGPGPATEVLMPRLSAGSQTHERCDTVIHTVHIYTPDLLGLFGDVLSFAADPKAETALAVVRLSYDGDNGLLHAEATNRMVGGISTWDPDDMPDMPGDDDVQTGLGSQPGGGAESWTVFIPAIDAKSICADFKVAEPKKGSTATPVMLTLNCDDITGLVTVSRERVGRLTGKTISIKGDTSVPRWPDVSDVTTSAALNAPVGTVEASYFPTLLAPFLDVRTRGGHMTMHFVSEKIHFVTIGPRFSGFISPARDRDPRDEMAAAGVPAGANVGDEPDGVFPGGSVDRWLTGGIEP